jgi:putative toxin-antitoxin system antitoxin component (TIGR02293 family)
MAAHLAILHIQEILGGERVLGRKISGERDLIEVSRAGLPHSALESVRRVLGLSADSLAASLALPKRTLSRRKKQAKLTPQESDRLLRLARIAARAADVLGSAEKASAWLQRPNRALGNVTPLSQTDTDTGAHMVEQILGRIEHGVFS